MLSAFVLPDFGGEGADGDAPPRRLTKRQKQLISSYELSRGTGSYHRDKPKIKGFEPEKPAPILEKMLAFVEQESPVIPEPEPVQEIPVVI